MQRQADANSLMLLLALLCHLLPLLFRYSADSVELTADPSLYLSRTASIVMLVAYFAYLAFQLFTHRQLFEAEDVCFLNHENVEVVIWANILKVFNLKHYLYFVRKRKVTTMIQKKRL